MEPHLGYFSMMTAVTCRHVKSAAHRTCRISAASSSSTFLAMEKFSQFRDRGESFFFLLLLFSSSLLISLLHPSDICTSP